MIVARFFGEYHWIDVPDVCWILGCGRVFYTSLEIYSFLLIELTGIDVFEHKLYILIYKDKIYNICFGSFLQFMQMHNSTTHNAIDQTFSMNTIVLIL